MRLRISLTIALLLAATHVQAATRTVISYASFNERTAGALLVVSGPGFFPQTGSGRAPGVCPGRERCAVGVSRG